MTLVSNRIFESEDIRLDDHTYVSCTFNDCRLFYAGGYFGLDDTHINNPRWAFDGAAQRTIDLLFKFGLTIEGMQLPPQNESKSN